jgi:lambda repressor-like predicted transcriptional regulator
VKTRKEVPFKEHFTTEEGNAMTTATVNKPTANVNKKRVGVPESEKLLSKLFADVFQSYLECSDEVQEAIRDMVAVIKSPDATEEERESAVITIAEALFPSRHNGVIGIDFDQPYADVVPPDVKHILQQMDQEEAGFGERVAALLEAKGMTQGDLAAEIGIGQPAVSMIISRGCRPQRRTIEKIAQALKVSTEELWPGFKDG